MAALVVVRAIRERVSGSNQEAVYSAPTVSSLELASVEDTLPRLQGAQVEFTDSPPRSHQNINNISNHDGLRRCDYSLNLFT